MRISIDIFIGIWDCNMTMMAILFLPQYVKTQYVHFKLHQTTFFYIEKNFLTKLADDHIKCFSITKGSIYYMKH